MFAMLSYSSDFEVLENNVLHNIVDDICISFKKNDILDLFSVFKTISASAYFLDLRSFVPYYSAIV